MQAARNEVQLVPRLVDPELAALRCRSCARGLYTRVGFEDVWTLAGIPEKVAYMTIEHACCEDWEVGRGLVGRPPTSRSSSSVR